MPSELVKADYCKKKKIAIVLQCDSKCIIAL